jgi:hypothetical protein
MGQPKGTHCRRSLDPGVATDDVGTRLDLYKLAVEMADRVSARRAGANNFFFTLHAALAAFVGIVSSARMAPPKGALPTFDAFGLVVTAIAGVVLSFTWWQLLRYYRRLNRAKFAVIIRMEASLPERPFTDEWAELHPGERPGPDDRPHENALKRWLRRSRHREASVVEQVVPLVFAAIYVVLGIRALTQ